MKINVEFTNLKELKEFAEFIRGNKAETMITSKEITTNGFSAINNEAEKEVVAEIHEAVMTENDAEEKALIEQCDNKSPKEITEIATVEVFDNTPEVKEKEQEVKDEAPQATEEEQVAGDKLDIEDVRSVVKKLTKAGKAKEAKQILKKYGAKKISDLKETCYVDVITEAGEILEKEVK